MNKYVCLFPTFHLVSFMRRKPFPFRMTSIQDIRAQLLEKSRALQKQYKITDQVDKLAEIQQNISKEETRKKRKITKKKSISMSNSTSQENIRRSKRLLGEEADLSNVDVAFLETTSRVSTASADPRFVKSGNLAGNEVSDNPITIDNVTYNDDTMVVNANDKEIMDNMQLQVIGPLHRVMRHRISAMAMHQSNICALGDKEGHVALWKFDNVVDGTDDLIISNLNIHDSNISHVAFMGSSNKSLLTTCYGNMRITDLNTFESEELIKEYKISAVYTSSDENGEDHIYYGGTDGKVHLRDLKSRRSSRILATTEGKKVNTIDVRNNTIMISGLNRKVQLYDLRNTRDVVSEFEHGYSVNSAYFNTTGTQIVTTSYDNYLRLFNTQSVNQGPSMKRVHDCQTGKWVSKFKAKFDYSDSVIYCGDKSRKIMYYSLKNMKKLYSVDDFSAIPAIVCTRDKWTWNSSDYVITGNATGKCQILKGIKKEI